MARGQRRERGAPAVFAEVGDHDHEAGTAGHATRAGEGTAERAGDDPIVRADHDPSAAVLGVGRDALGERALDHDLRVAAAARRQQPPLGGAGA